MLFSKEFGASLQLKFKDISTGSVIHLKGVPDHAISFVLDELGKLLGFCVNTRIFRNQDVYDSWLEEYLGGSKVELHEKVVMDDVKIIEDLPFNSDVLIGIGYRRIGRVSDPGEFSLYGDVLVLWIVGWQNPVRVSLLGDRVESISLIDAESKQLYEKLSSLKVNEVGGVGKEVGNDLYDQYVGNQIAEKELPYTFCYVRGGSLISKPLFDGEICDTYDIDFGIETIPLEGSLANPQNVLKHLLLRFKTDGYSVMYWGREKARYDEVADIYDELIDGTEFLKKGMVGTPLTKGVVSKQNRLVVLTDFELFGELNLSDDEIFLGDTVTGSLSKRNELSKRDKVFKQILPGDYIVHEDHGIGQYKGLMKREGVMYMDITYAKKDRLYVPITQARKITKFIGSGGKVPKLTTLNSGIWRRIVKKAGEDAEEVAKELVQLYAMRSITNTTVQLLPDHRKDVDAFIKRFEFTDTPDQLAATHEVLQDLQSDFPMDRLLVGDVGFGKTEIAMRAMYATVAAGGQVAFLAPTTILVEQHVSVIKKRFKGTGVNVVALSRFLSVADTRQIVKRLEEGDIDIVVGTHSLLSEKIKFNNLGIIVVDEEQKFGVKQKEKLKAKRLHAHVLALSATPIPRTLNMSLSGIRDISIIATPPEGRLPIKNAFAKYNWQPIVEALRKELDRKGQAYYLHNRVRTIDAIRKKVAREFPDKVVERAHGQLPPEELTLIMRQFAEGEIDILVCTTIIENGIDLPNVNTLVVSDAQRYGLSQLYQIRGRVGRSTRQGYAYFYYSSLKGRSGQRMDALAQSEELGSGFMLSSKDLEIRGAGNLLGKAQSGTIHSVGYGLYITLLQQKVSELKEGL